MFVNALEKHSDSMPANEEHQETISGNSELTLYIVAHVTTPTGVAGSSSAGWTGWAVSSFTKLYGSRTGEGEEKKPVTQTNQSGYCKNESRSVAMIHM